ncbi:MAG: hypothetical protein DRQ98_12685, partial [Gammaproteobacteria bacterium]
MKWCDRRGAALGVFWRYIAKGLAKTRAFPDNNALIFALPGSPMTTLNILMAQMNTFVGDFEGNT